MFSFYAIVPDNMPFVLPLCVKTIMSRCLCLLVACVEVNDQGRRNRERKRGRKVTLSNETNAGGDRERREGS